MFVVGKAGDGIGGQVGAAGVAVNTEGRPEGCIGGGRRRGLAGWMGGWEVWVMEGCGPGGSWEVAGVEWTEGG